MNRSIALVLLVFAAAPVSAQTAATPTEQAIAPIECWWKTDRSAVRVGERFQLTLTCAVIDTDKIKVVVDESSLGPSALHLVPFEIVGGQRFRDIMNSPRRFFQYQYTMRVLGEDFFGKEVTLPRLQLSYRVQNSLNGGSAIAGREALYSLRPVPIRVLSLVPTGTIDIRDTPVDTFGDVDARLFRASTLMIGAGVLLALAALLVIVAIARAALRRRGTTTVRDTSVGPALVLRAASRELASVRSASQGGWNGELAGRAAASLRLAGAVLLGRPVGQRPANRGVEASEGQIAVRRGFLGKQVMLSAAVTPSGPTANGAAPSGWNGISQPLATFTALRYSRGAAADGVALDSALAEAQDAVKQLRWRQLFRLARPKPVAETTKPTWAR